MRCYLLLALATFTGLSLAYEKDLQAQVTPDGTTATTVDGNQINPVGSGTVNGNNLFHSFDQFNVPSGCVIFGTDGSSVDGNSIKKSW